MPKAMMIEIPKIKAHEFFIRIIFMKRNLAVWRLCEKKVTTFFQEMKLFPVLFVLTQSPR
jgi:hypothetical protein